jgi:hypothetical protein
VNFDLVSTAVDLVDKDEKKVNRNRENDVEFNYTSPSFPVTKSKGDGNVLSDPHALQLVIGKTMREELGEDVAVAFCKNIKCGQLVLVTGRLGGYISFTCHIILGCSVLHCIKLDCAALHYTTLCCIMSLCVVPYCIVLYCIALYCIALYCSILYFTVLYFTALYCTDLYCILYRNLTAREISTIHQK